MSTRRVRTDSLTEFLHWATERDAQAMVVAADDELKRRRAAREERGEPPPPRTAAPKRTYRELFEQDPDMATPPTPSPRAAMTRETAPTDVGAAAVLTGAPVATTTAPELPRPADGKTYSRAQWEGMYAVWSARLNSLDAMKKPADVATLKGGALPQAVLQIIKETDDLEAYFAALPDNDETEQVDEDGQPLTVSAF
jgi:hypothetical protein